MLPKLADDPNEGKWIIVGFILFCSVLGLLSLLAYFVGVNVLDNSETGFTIEGIYLSLLSMLLTWRLHRSLRSRKWFGGVTSNERIGWRQIVLGLTALEIWTRLALKTSQSLKLPSVVFLLVVIFGGGTIVKFFQHRFDRMAN